MYLNYYFIILLFFICFSAEAQWQEIDQINSNPIKSISFINDDFGYVLNNKELLETHDGCNSFNVLLPETGIRYSDMTITSDSTIFVLGSDFSNNVSLILKSENFGFSWDTTTINNTVLLNFIYFLDENFGYTAGIGGIAYRTFNGGIDWEATDFGTILNINDIFFFDESNGVAVGGVFDNGLILETQNSGITWNFATYSAISELRSITRLSNEKLITVGNQGSILESVDLGKSWDSIQIESNFNYFDVQFVDDLNGFISGGESQQSSILKTTNGGNSWIETFDEGLTYVTKINYIHQNLAVSGLNNGDLFKYYVDDTLSFAKTNETLNLVIYPNPASDKVYLDIDISYNLTFEIYDSTGDKLRSGSLLKNWIDINSLKSGTYILIVKKGKVFKTIRFIKFT